MQHALSKANALIDRATKLNNRYVKLLCSNKIRQTDFNLRRTYFNMTSLCQPIFHMNFTFFVP